MLTDWPVAIAWTAGEPARRTHRGRHCLLGSNSCACLHRTVAKVDNGASAMQITIEDLSPVEKSVEFELPWSDVVPKLDKAYDSLRRGVRLPGFRPGRCRARSSRRCTSARSRTRSRATWSSTRSGQAIRENQLQPVAPPDRRRAGDQVGRAVQVHARGSRCGRRSTPKDYSGVAAVKRRPAKVTDEQVTEALEGYRRRLTEYKPVEGRTETGDTDLLLVEVSGRVGRAQAQARQVAVDLENETEGALPGLATPAARQADRRRADRGRVHAGRRGLRAGAGRQGRSHLHVTIKEAREKKVPALDDEMAKDTGEAETLDGLRDEDARAAARAGRAPHQARDDAAR